MTRVLHVWSEILQFFQPREKRIFTKTFDEERQCNVVVEMIHNYISIFFFFFLNIYNNITLYIYK